MKETDSRLWDPHPGEIWAPRYKKSLSSYKYIVATNEVSGETLYLEGDKLFVIVEVKPHPTMMNIVVFLYHNMLWEIRVGNFIDTCYNINNEEYVKRVVNVREKMLNKKKGGNLERRK